MLVHCDNDFVHRQLELFGRALHDAQVGLVWDQPIHISRCFSRFGQGGTSRTIQQANGQLEYRLTIHF